MGFEDKMSVEDLMKKPQKELMVEIYIQTVKTNGAVTRHNEDIEALKTECKHKIGIKLFTGLTAILAFIMIISEVLDWIGI